MYCHVTTETAFCVFHFLQRFFPEWPIRTCSKITAVLLLCTDDDNRSYWNVCNMSFLSFALAVIFIIKFMETDLHLQISQHQASLKHENFTLSYHSYTTLPPQTILQLQLHFSCTLYNIKMWGWQKLGLVGMVSYHYIRGVQSFAIAGRITFIYMKYDRQWIRVIFMRCV